MSADVIAMEPPAMLDQTIEERIEQEIHMNGAKAGHEFWREQQKGKKTPGYPRDELILDNFLAFLPIGFLKEIKENFPRISPEISTSKVAELRKKFLDLFQQRLNEGVNMYIELPDMMKHIAKDSDFIDVLIQIQCPIAHPGLFPYDFIQEVAKFPEAESEEFSSNLESMKNRFITTLRKYVPDSLSEAAFSKVLILLNDPY